jgi:hypothetical protein
LTHTILVVPGWNLVHVSLHPLDTTPSVVLAPISGSYDLVYAYDGCDLADHWKTYNPYAPPFVNDLTYIDETRGIWVHATVTDTLVVTGTVSSQVTTQMCAGWNLVGHSSLQALPVHEALASIEGKYEIVYAFDASDTADPWKKYDPSAPSYTNDLTEMQPGLGYWIKVMEDCTWTINN